MAGPFDTYISEASRRFGVPEAWIRSVIQSESAGKPNALGPKTRFGTHAQGLMQIMPPTYAELAKKHGLGPDPFDPRNNILGGTAYLGELAQRFNNDPTAVAAAYNMGPNAYAQYQAGKRRMPGETTTFVSRTAPRMGPWQPAAAPPPVPATPPAEPPPENPQASIAEVYDRTEGPLARPPMVSPDRATPPAEALPQPPQGTLPTGGLLDQALATLQTGLLGNGQPAVEKTGMPWYDRATEWATRPPGPFESALQGVADAMAPLSGWRTGLPVSTAQVLAAAAGGLRTGAKDYRQGQIERLTTALKIDEAQRSRSTALNKIEAAKRYAAPLRATNNPRLMAIADAIEYDPTLLDEAVRAQFPKPGSLKTVNTAEGVFVLNPDGSRGERIGSPTTTARTPQVKTVTLGDGVYVVNPDGSRGARLGDAPPKGAGPKTVTTADGVFVLNPDGTLGNRLGASETAPDLGVAGQEPDADLARQIGLPLPAPAPWQNPNLSVRGRSNLVASTRKTLDKRFEENDEQVAKATALTQDMQRFLFLNQRTPTGDPWSAPYVGGVSAFFDADLKEMRSITARITPTLRQPGSGATSDFDARMFQEGTVGTDKPLEVNKNIAQGALAAAENIAGKAAFERAYGETWGHLNGAEAAWKRYLEANPIFDPQAPAGSFTINTKRQKWGDYFRGELTAGPPAPPPDAAQTPPGEFGQMTPPLKPEPLPPINTPTPMVLPPVEQRVIGQTYDTPRGKAIWRGEGWELVSP